MQAQLLPRYIPTLIALWAEHGDAKQARCDADIECRNLPVRHTSIAGPHQGL